MTWRVVAVPLLVLGVVGQALVLASWPAAHLLMIDLEVYRAGGARVLDGAELYSGGVVLDLPFVYPPFAAALFAPFALLPMGVLKVAWTAAGVGALVIVARRCGWGTPGAVVAAVLLALCLDPVRTTFYLGQINVVLLALVLCDLTGTRRWRGVGVGIAAAVKLTPLLFVGYLLVTRQWRAAGTAVGTFAAATALGFLAAPGESARFWFGGTFAAADRISAVGGPSNHSVRGLLARAGIEGPWWLLVTVALGVLTLLVARAAHALPATGAPDLPPPPSVPPAGRGDEILALTVVGLGAAALAPFAWSHHYVWVFPLVLFLASRRMWWPLAVVLVATAAFVTRLPGPDVGPIPATGLVSLFPDAYVLLFLAVLAACLPLARTHGERPRPDVLRPGPSA